MTKIAVVALGGNALTRAGQSGSCDEMMANAAAMATAVNDVLTAGWRVVIVHGNGPQVGNLALQQEATSAVPAQPLEQPRDRAERLLIQLGLRHHQREEHGLGLVAGPRHGRWHTRS